MRQEYEHSSGRGNEQGFVLGGHCRYVECACRGGVHKHAQQVRHWTHGPMRVQHVPVKEICSF